MRLTQCARRLLLCLVVLSCLVEAQASSKTSLPPKYAAWLTEEVPYIITNAEKSAFLALKTDADREAHRAFVATLGDKPIWNEFLGA